MATQTYTYNRFKDTKIYGTLKNSDNGSNLASASFDRTLQVGTDLTVGGNSTVTGNSTVSGTHTVTGLSSVGSLTVGGTSVVIGNYLKTADAQSTYQPISSMSQYYTKTSIDSALASNSTADKNYTDTSVSALKSTVDASFNSLNSSLTSAIASNSTGDRAYSDNAVSTLKTYVDGSLNSTNTLISSSINTANTANRAYTDTAISGLKVNYIDTLSTHVDASYNALNTALNNYISSATTASGSYASLTGDLNLLHKLTVADDVTCSKDLNVTGNFFLGGQLIQSSLSSLSDQINSVSASVSVDLSTVPKLATVNNYTGIINNFPKIGLSTPPVMSYATLPSLQSNQVGYCNFTSSTSTVGVISGTVINLGSLTLEAGYYIITFTVQAKLSAAAAQINSSYFGLCGSNSALPSQTNGAYPEGISEIQLTNNLQISNNSIRNIGTWMGAYNSFSPSDGKVYLNILSAFSGTNMSVIYSSINAMRIA